MWRLWVFSILTYKVCENTSDWKLFYNYADTDCRHYFFWAYKREWNESYLPVNCSRSDTRAWPREISRLEANIYRPCCPSFVQIISQSGHTKFCVLVCQAILLGIHHHYMWCINDYFSLFTHPQCLSYYSSSSILIIFFPLPITFASQCYPYNKKNTFKMFLQCHSIKTWCSCHLEGTA